MIRESINPNCVTAWESFVRGTLMHILNHTNRREQEKKKSPNEILRSLGMELCRSWVCVDIAKYIHYIWEKPWKKAFQRLRRTDNRPSPSSFLLLFLFVCGLFWFLCECVAPFDVIHSFFTISMSDWCWILKEMRVKIKYNTRTPCHAVYHTGPNGQ